MSLFLFYNDTPKTKFLKSNLMSLKTNATFSRKIITSELLKLNREYILKHVKLKKRNKKKEQKSEHHKI